MTGASNAPDEFAGTRRYTPTRLLGAGSWGRVYQAYDNERNAFVAVKLLSRASPEALLRFKREFRALTDVVHPNLVTLYELLNDQAQWFFTMQLVDGHSFLEYVHGPRAALSAAHPSSSATVAGPTVDWRPPRRSGSQLRTATVDPSPPTVEPLVRPAPSLPAQRQPALPPAALERLRGALGQLVDGLAALHDAGKLHRDVKPSNVLVDREGRVVLLDFGLVHELEGAQAERLVVGTPAYMSPEQSAGAPVREATDWYAMGVLLFEALTGKVPFEGLGPQMTLGRSQLPAPRPGDYAEGVPDDLDQLCEQLLSPRSEQRPTGAQLRERLRRPDMPSAGRATDSGLPLLGRDGELATLHAAFDVVREQRRAAMVLVEGASGLGKTALLRRFRSELKASGAVVFEARCSEMETVPFKAFDGVIDELTAHLSALSASRCEQLLPRDFNSLARLFPVLKRVEVPAALKRVAVPADVLDGRRRGFAALRALLTALTESSPVAVLLDDVHWGDADSAALLAAVLHSAELPPLLLVAAYRGTDPGLVAIAPAPGASPRADERASAAPVLRALDEAARLGAAVTGLWPSRVGLGPLPDSVGLTVAHALLPQAAPEVDFSALVREARGSPHLLEVLTAMASQHASTLQSWARARAEALSGPSRRLLEVVAVAGRPVERLVAWHAADLDTEVTDPLVPLKSARLLSSDGGSVGRPERLFAYSAEIGRAVRGLVAPAVAKAILLKLADALEATGRVDDESVADWCAEAGQPDRASRASEAAADRASGVMAFERAAQLYERAMAGRDEGERRRLTLSRANALAGAGRGRDAAAAFLTLARGASRLEAIELRQRAAEQLLFGGHVDAGIEVLSEVMSQIGAPMPKSRALTRLLTLFNRARVELRGLEYTPRPESDVSRETLAQVDAYFAAAKGISLVDPMRGTGFQFAHYRLALDAGEPYRVGRALAFEAGFHALMGAPHRVPCLNTLEALKRLLAEHPHEHLDGLYWLMAGCEALSTGRFVDSRPLHARAVEHFREKCPGMTWELTTALQYLVHALWNLGEYPEARALSAEVREWANARTDAYASTNFRVRVASIIKLMDDDPAGASAEVDQALAAFSSSGYFTQHFWGFNGRVLADLYRGDGEGALARVRAEWPLIRASGLTRIQMARVMVTHLKSCVQVFDVRATRPSLEREAAQLEAEQVPWALGFAALVRAAAAARFGDTAGALEQLELGARHLESVGALTHAWSARRWSSVLMGPSGRALEDAADQWFKARGVKQPARFAAAFCPGPWTA